jgi:hypothetical protein
MSTALKIWILGGLVAVNAMLTVSLAWSWRYMYVQYSYPIDFFLPLDHTSRRITLVLFVCTFSVPLSFITCRSAGPELPSVARVLTLVTSGAAASVALAFSIWRYR